MKTTDHTKQTIQELSLPDQSPLIRETGRSSIFLPPQGGGTFCEAKRGGAFGRGVRAFTLVELIIVITILAILATIAFMSFQGYMKQSRDAVRVSDLASASKGLSIFFTKSGVYPEVQSGVTITVNGYPIGFQGSLGESVMRAIQLNKIPIDPLDNSNYVYRTNDTKSWYQIGSFTEGGIELSFIPQIYADEDQRSLYTQGNSLGIILDANNQPITSTGIDILQTNDTYQAIINNSANGIIVGTGRELIQINPYLNCQRLAELGGSKGDGMYSINPYGSGFFQVYCDMTTDGGGWMLIGRSGNACTNSGSYGFFFDTQTKPADISECYSQNIERLYFKEFQFGEFSDTKTFVTTRGLRFDLTPEIIKQKAGIETGSGVYWSFQSTRGWGFNCGSGKSWHRGKENKARLSATGYPFGCTWSNCNGQSNWKGTKIPTQYYYFESCYLGMDYEYRKIWNYYSVWGR